MKKYLTLSTLFRVIAAGMLFYALKDKLNIDYFTTLRFVVCAVSIFSAYIAFKAKSSAWITIFALIAALFNPIFQVTLGRRTWTKVDIVAAVLLLASIFFVQESKDSEIIDEK